MYTLIELVVNLVSNHGLCYLIIFFASVWMCVLYIIEEKNMFNGLTI